MNNNRMTVNLPNDVKFEVETIYVLFNVSLNYKRKNSLVAYVHLLLRAECWNTIHIYTIIYEFCGWQIAFNNTNS